MNLTIADVLGVSNAPAGDSWDYWVARSREGLDKQTLKRLLVSLDVSLADIAPLLPVTERTLQRYPDEKTLSRDLSGHIVAIAKVFVRAAKVFEDQNKARRWLNKPCRALGGEIPLSLLDTPLGIQVVENELARIEYGVYV